VIKKSKISEKDLNTWKDYIKDPKDIVDKEKSNKQNLAIRGRYKFDLHGYSLDEANKKVREIILFCIEKRFKEILIITGKGLHSNIETDVYSSKDYSKLKHSIPEYIKSDGEILKNVSSISNASIEDGGEGALIIRLKKL
tara:strand:- start:141 stop:560 length:420 start_codon:yes stop_codon:yes gene_type:complete